MRWFVAVGMASSSAICGGLIDGARGMAIGAVVGLALFWLARFRGLEEAGPSDLYFPAPLPDGTCSPTTASSSTP